MKFHPASKVFPAMGSAELDALVDDIRQHGLLQPIQLHPNGEILDGRSRYLACQQAGVEPRYETWIGSGSPIEYVISMNLRRRQLTASQKAALAVDLLPLLEETAAKRQKAGLKRGCEKQTPVSPRLDQRDESGKASATAAQLLGVGRQYVAEAKKLSEQHPDLYMDVRSGKRSLQEAKREIRELEKQAIANRITNEPPPLPDGPFRVIVVDPPWPVTDASYPVMTVDVISTLRIAELAHEHCILWLWTTNNFIREAFRCLEAWGFEYKTQLTWVKDRPGTGHWLRCQTEPCLMAVRGRPPVTLSDQSTVLHAKVREHSRKPEEFFRLVESLCPGTKLELFARERREGWVAWGAEVDHFTSSGPKSA